jgi:hypothetical protein
MKYEYKERLVVIIALIIIGAALASTVTKYLESEAQLNHHVTTGKVGSNSDDTIWVAEFIKDKVVFNYTLPASSVHSKYLYYEAVSIVAVPEYQQNFEIVRNEEGQYAVYIPERDTIVLTSNLENYMKQYEDTILLKGYSLFGESLSDIRVLSKVHESKFSVNGIVTIIHSDRTTSISGYILTTEDAHYMVMMNIKEKNIKEVRSIEFEYK